MNNRKYVLEVPIKTGKNNQTYRVIYSSDNKDLLKKMLDAQLKYARGGFIVDTTDYGSGS